MSEVEFVKGTLKKFPRNENESKKEYLIRFFDYKGITSFEDFNDDECGDALADALWKKALLIKNVIFEITNEEDMYESDIREAKVNSYGSIDFLVQFYNGCTTLVESIEESIEKHGIICE
jgi:hypothetical protein